MRLGDVEHGAGAEEAGAIQECQPPPEGSGWGLLACERIALLAWLLAGNQQNTNTLRYFAGVNNGECSKKGAHFLACRLRRWDVGGLRGDSTVEHLQQRCAKSGKCRMRATRSGTMSSIIATAACAATTTGGSAGDSLASRCFRPLSYPSGTAGSRRTSDLLTPSPAWATTRSRPNLLTAH